MGLVNVRLERQVVEFIKTLAPETRQKFHAALTALGKGTGDTLPLEAELTGFYRLRIGSCQIIYRHAPSSSGPEIVCEFVQQRDIVYEMFAAILAEQGRL
jgi:mRNA-degrading endonuclease RelE of RelBE toxin-antitoxin system